MCIRDRVYKAQIRNSVMVEEAQANRIDIYSYDEKNNVSKDYMIFIDEYLSGLGKEKINV